MGMRLIFVGGIHGVGKSSFCSKLASALGLRHFSAGALIGDRREVAQSADKRVVNVNDNQDVLIEAVQAISISDSPVLLDGHFCVLNLSEELTRIPTQTFERLAPIAALVIHDDVQAIQERLRNRDGRNYSLAALGAYQDAELSHARTVCSIIGAKLCTLRPDMLPEALEFVTQELAIQNL